MENMINSDMMSRVADKPKINESWGEFPYEDVISTLVLLDSTKSMKFTTKEMTKNRIAYLKHKAKTMGIKLKCATKEGYMYVWAVRNISQA